MAGLRELNVNLFGGACVSSTKEMREWVYTTIRPNLSMFLHDKCAHRRTSLAFSFPQPLLQDIPNMDFISSFHQFSLVLTVSEHRQDSSHNGN